MELRLGAGDAFYLPVGWRHCVERSAERNMILNLFFGMKVHSYDAKVDPERPVTRAGEVCVGTGPRYKNREQNRTEYE